MGIRSAIRKYREQIAGLIAPPSADTPSSGISRSASSTTPYEAGGQGRRATNWQASRLGPSTLLWGNLDMMRARARDSVRNDPWAMSAADNFESQHIGNGIRPRWNIPDKTLKKTIEKEFARWATSSMCDFAGRLDFYGLQALAAREMFEAGEVFTQYIVRPKSWNMRVPLQLKLMEGEQLSLFRNIFANEGGVKGMPPENRIRTGIEFDPQGRRAAYHFYKEHPGETMFYPLDGLVFQRIPAEDILHTYKVYRAGQLRGQPHLSAVLTLLYELEQYTDAALVKKKVAAMFAGFIEKVNADADVLPPDPNNPIGNLQQSQPIGVQPAQDPETVNVKLEPGTMNVLLPGEKIIFPQPPTEADFEAFLSIEMHKFAVGIGATYEQITGDLKGVNYSSIRAGLLDFRRKCEQFQRNVLIRQFCAPIVNRWMQEAVLVGRLDLPGYATDPGQYESAVEWATPAWPWVDPLKDVQAAQTEVRSGFTSREKVVSEMGDSVEDIDAQQVADNERADDLGLVYDSRADQVLIGRETNPQVDETDGPAAASDTTPAQPSSPTKPASKPKAKPQSKPSSKPSSTNK